MSDTPDVWPPPAPDPDTEPVHEGAEDERDPRRHPQPDDDS